MKKRFLALLTAVTMTLGMSMTAMAADAPTYTLTISPKAEGHEYEAYQIFDLETDVLGNVKTVAWGNGVTEAGQSALVEWAEGTDSTAYSDKDDQPTKVEKVLATKQNESSIVKEFEEKAQTGLSDKKTTGSATDSEYKIADLSVGYYLIKDTFSFKLGEETKYFLVYITDNITVAPKVDTVTSIKKVDDVNDSDPTNEDRHVNGKLEDTADYDLGDKVPYTLVGTLPADFASYETYRYEFHDKMGAGLTFNKEDVTVYLADDTSDLSDVNSMTPIDATCYSVNTQPEDKDTFDVVFGNVKELKDSKGNSLSIDSSKKIVVKFTATLNENAIMGTDGNKNESYIKYSNNPSTDDMGETPKDKVVVFTYKVTVNKVDENEKPLSGAGFTLYKKYVSDAHAPAGAEKLSLDNFQKLENYTSDAKNDYYEVKTIKAGEDINTFAFTHLDDGEYVLVESETPNGYNTMNPFQFKIVADHRNDDEQNSLELVSLNGETLTGEVTIKSELSTGELSKNIVNRKGSILPSTGGIGTTIFYIIGGVLVIGAGVVLFTKKKMAKEEN